MENYTRGRFTTSSRLACTKDQPTMDHTGTSGKATFCH